MGSDRPDVSMGSMSDVHAMTEVRMGVVAKLYLWFDKQREAPKEDQIPQPWLILIFSQNFYFLWFKVL